MLDSVTDEFFFGAIVAVGFAFELHADLGVGNFARAPAVMISVYDSQFDSQDCIPRRLGVYMEPVGYLKVVAVTQII